MRTVSRRGILWAWLALGLAGCLSPTLPPLPPPSAPSEMSYLSRGQLQLSGYIGEERGLVYALNLANDEIAGEQVRAHRYSFVLDARPGDPIQLWYTVGDEQSDVRQFWAPEYPSETSNDAGVETSNDAGVETPNDAGVETSNDAGVETPSDADADSTAPDGGLPLNE